MCLSFRVYMSEKIYKGLNKKLLTQDPEGSWAFAFPPFLFPRRSGNLWMDYLWSDKEFCFDHLLILEKDYNLTQLTISQFFAPTFTGRFPASLLELIVLGYGKVGITCRRDQIPDTVDVFW